MKTKILTLAAAAFTLAIGGAVASTFVDTTVVVHAKISSSADPIRCFNTSAICDEYGTLSCTVTITQSIDGTLRTAQTYGTYGVYKPNTVTSCTEVLRGSHAYPIATGQSVYQLFN
jgi:predicted phosphatase